MEKAAVLMAGGFGTRLRPLTDSIPKPLLPIAGRPTLEWALELLRQYGFSKAVITLGYRADQIKQHFGSRYHDIELVYTLEKEPLGTGGPLHLAKPHLNGTFFMLFTDNLYDIDLDDMLKFHKKERVIGTTALKEFDDPSPFGVAVMDGNRIAHFVEKPKKEEAPSKLVDTGLYVFEPEFLTHVPQTFNILGKDVFPRLAASKMVAGYPFKGQWFPTDTMERYAVANAFWKNPIAPKQGL